MRHSMPHRNNIGGARRCCKGFLSPLPDAPAKLLLEVIFADPGLIAAATRSACENSKIQR